LLPDVLVCAIALANNAEVASKAQAVTILPMALPAGLCGLLECFVHGKSFNLFNG
jgi:hypothetical protein